MPGSSGGKKMAGGSSKPRYSGGIGTAVTSKPGGPMVTLGGRGPAPSPKAVASRSTTVGKAVERRAMPAPMPHPATPRPASNRQQRRI